MPRRGNQLPTYSWCESYTLTEGEHAAKLADTYGLSPHPWQRLILNDWLAVDTSGKLLNSLCVLPVPRQNGKTGVCDPRETWGLVRRGESILHTAQEYQTAKKAFDRLREKFGDRRNDPRAKYPELNALVKKYTTSANQMVLDLKNGAHIEFRTRGANSDMGRGGTFDLVVIDEAQSYTDAQDAALSPLNSAAPSGSPQTILMGTVPDPAASYKGEKFASIRDSLHKKPYKGACIHEWSVEEIGDVFDTSRWYATNPSLGFQLLESALMKDARTMSETAFAREHLGWWSPTAGMPDFAIPANKFESLALDVAPTDGRVAYAVKFSPDGSELSLAAARLHDGKVYIEQIKRESMALGLSWLAEWIAARKTKGCCCLIDGKSGAQALVDKLGMMPTNYIITPNASQVIAACTTLVDCVNEGTLEWFRPQADLLDSAITSTRRKIGSTGGWGFGGENPIPISAAALAVWGVFNSKRNPERKQRIG